MPVSDLWTDTPPSNQQISTLRPEQQAVQNQALGRVSELFGQTSPKQFNFAPIEQKAREDFQTKTVPSLAERFVGQGSGTRSSAFRGALASSGGELETNLAALGAEYGLRGQELQQHHLTNLLQQGLGKSFDTTREPGQESFLKQVVKSAAPTLAELAVKKLFGYGAEVAPAVKAAVTSSLGAETPEAVKDIVGTTAAATGGWSPAWAALPPAVAIAGSLLLINRQINKLESEGKAQEAEDAKKEAAKLQKYYDDKASGKFGSQIDWPKREANEDTSSFLNRVIQSSNQRLSDRQAAQGQSTQAAQPTQATQPSQVAEILQNPQATQPAQGQPNDPNLNYNYSGPGKLDLTYNQTKLPKIRGPR